MMMRPQVTIAKVSEDIIDLRGTLNFASVPSLKDAIVPFLSSLDKLTVNLSGVSYSDSTGLALLSEWLRLVKAQNKVIEYIGMPEQMRAIATVTGMCKILPIQDS